MEKSEFRLVRRELFRFKPRLTFPPKAQICGLNIIVHAVGYHYCQAHQDY